MENMLKIEKGIPFKKGQDYPLAEMEVGDSFIVPKGNIKLASMQIAAVRITKEWMKLNQKDWKFKTSIREEGGLRVWRVK